MVLVWILFHRWWWTVQTPPPKPSISPWMAVWNPSKYRRKTSYHPCHPPFIPHHFPQEWSRKWAKPTPLCSGAGASRPPPHSVWPGTKIPLEKLLHCRGKRWKKRKIGRENGEWPPRRRAAPLPSRISPRIRFFSPNRTILWRRSGKVVRSRRVGRAPTPAGETFVRTRCRGWVCWATTGIPLISMERKFRSKKFSSPREAQLRSCRRPSRGAPSTQRGEFTRERAPNRRRVEEWGRNCGRSRRCTTFVSLFMTPCWGTRSLGQFWWKSAVIWTIRWGRVSLTGSLGSSFCGPLTGCRWCGIIFTGMTGRISRWLSTGWGRWCRFLKGKIFSSMKFINYEIFSFFKNQFQFSVCFSPWGHLVSDRSTDWLIDCFLSGSVIGLLNWLIDWFFD